MTTEFTNSTTELVHGFVIGCPRSGTTLVQTELTKSSQISTFPETQLFPNLVGMTDWHAGKVRNESYVSYGVDCLRKVMLVVGYGRSVSRNYTTQLKEIGEHLNDPDFMNCQFPNTKKLRRLVDYAIELFDRVAMREGTCGWIEKSPTHLRYTNSIQRYVARAQFIHVIRDGRATVASIWEAVERGYPYWKENFPTIEACIAIWNSDLKKTLACAGKPSHLVFNYHQFAKDPLVHKSAAWDFLNLEAVNNDEPIKQIASKAIMPHEKWKANTENPILDYGLKKFNAIFTAEQKQFIERELIKGGDVSYLGKLPLKSGSR